MRNILLLTFAVSIFWVGTVNATIFGENWCKLTAEDTTSILKKKYVFGRGDMAGGTFDAEIQNDSDVYAVTEIEIEVSGTYNRGRPFKRTAVASVFLEPGESERVFFSVDSDLSSSIVDLEKWRILRLMSCRWD